ncbi:hypothetical protein J1614_001233 [Plenodomus biglobosus]|nr:hypothetical protein J1614_001233 [Plenodomus biglobosus]
MSSMHLRIHLVLISQFLLPFQIRANSPQLCYYANDTLASDDIIPCYTSVTSDHYSCCKVGDKCLRHNACYSLDFGVTYQYGCTDSTFQDSHCPSKCNLDTERSPWVGLVFCNGARATPKNMWICHHPDNCGGRTDCAEGNWEPGLQKLWDTTCENIINEPPYVAFEESSTLSDIAALPVKTELSKWWVDHADRTMITTSSLLATSVIAESPTTPTMTSATASTAPRKISSLTDLIPTPTIPATTNKKPTSTTLGIGVGLGNPILLALIALSIFYLRRHRKKHKAALTALPASSDEYPPEKQDVHASHVHHAELDGTPIFESPGSPHPSELQGSTAMTTPAACQSPFASPETVQTGFGGGHSAQCGGVVGERGNGVKVHEMPC